MLFAVVPPLDVFRAMCTSLKRRKRSGRQSVELNRSKGFLRFCHGRCFQVWRRACGGGQTLQHALVRSFQTGASTCGVWVNCASCFAQGQQRWQEEAKGGAGLGWSFLRFGFLLFHFAGGARRWQGQVSLRLLATKELSVSCWEG